MKDWHLFSIDGKIPLFGVNTQELDKLPYGHKHKVLNLMINWCADQKEKLKINDNEKG